MNTITTPAAGRSDRVSAVEIVGVEVVLNIVFTYLVYVGVVSHAPILVYVGVALSGISLVAGTYVAILLRQEHRRTLAG